MSVSFNASHDVSKYEMPREARESLQEFSAKIAKEVARTRDRLIEEAVTALLGHEDWNPRELAGRLRRLGHPERPEEHWQLDGKPLISIWPSEVINADGQITLKIKYQKFPTP